MSFIDDNFDDYYDYLEEYGIGDTGLVDDLDDDEDDDMDEDEIYNDNGVLFEDEDDDEDMDDDLDDYFENDIEDTDMPDFYEGLNNGERAIMRGLIDNDNNEYEA